MLKLAAIQVSATPDPARNLRKAAQFLEAAAQRGARIACLPELFPLPWFPRERDPVHFELAESPEGARVTAVADLARQHQIAVVCPFFERAADGLYYNSALLFDSRGKRVGLYRKVHVPDLSLWEERYYFAPGNLGFPVFEVEGVRIGIQICWDNFFPEGFRCLALAGAQVIFVPTAAAFASQQRWLAMGVSHAVANGVYVMRVNRVGKEAQQDFYGHSFCVKPDGELAAEPIGGNEGVLLVDFDPREVERARRVWPFLKDRRPREYAAVVGIEWGPGLLEAEQKSDRGAAELPPSGPSAATAASDAPTSPLEGFLAQT
ncbi:MAG: acyltransferase [Deltaproteobacteria bacterium]|nr:acyltransferase [Deltaproteobacteria bacterium]